MNSPLDSGVIEMRPDERLDVQTLETFLHGKLPDTHGKLNVRQFSTGAANLTYLLEYDNAQYVLRRPPLGPVPKGAHDMERESRILTALHKSFSLAPKVYFFQSESKIINAPFFVMERKPGFVIDKILPEPIEHDSELKTRLAWMVIDTLAELHSVDPDSVGLGELGRPEGYALRQLEGWTRRWVAAQGDSYSGAEEIIKQLSDDIPQPSRISLVHNDFKLNNIMVDQFDPCVPTAVLDWDMCTRGDPLFDLGLLLVYWAEPEDSPEMVQAATMPGFSKGGFPTREEAIARYADVSGIDTGNIRWYYLFGIFKLMGILQQIFIRYQRGQTQDERFSVFGKRIEALVDKGLNVLNSENESFR